MGFITKNANIVLLFLIVLSATSLVGATVFFQMNFDRINTEYNQKLDQLKLVSQELEEREAVLNQIKGELVLKSEREEELGEKFTEVREEKESLELTREQLENANAQLESELESSETLLRETQLELDAKKDVIKTLEAEVADLETRLDVCEDERDNLEDDLQACEDDS